MIENPILLLSALMFLSYLVGSIPFGFLICKSKGIDIRTIGSGNIGATNVGRALGTKWKLVALILDLMKGLLPTLLLKQYIFKESSEGDIYLYAPILVGMFAIVGHNWPVYLKFKGGKGVATSAGVMLALAPISLLIGIFVYALVTKVTCFVSLGSIASSVAVAFSIPLTSNEDNQYLTGFGILICVLIILRHKKNIINLINGTENRIGH